ncbi:hypothetical protein METY_2913 [Methylopila sp. Yamaguchi]|nr:hypothetical protein METY_2913 [Methylopila sp. Yamaguchi]
MGVGLHARSVDGDAKHDRPYDARADQHDPEQVRDIAGLAACGVQRGLYAGAGAEPKGDEPERRKAGQLTCGDDGGPQGACCPSELSDDVRRASAAATRPVIFPA